MFRDTEITLKNFQRYSFFCSKDFQRYSRFSVLFSGHNFTVTSTPTFDITPSTQLSDTTPSTTQSDSAYSPTTFEERTSVPSTHYQTITSSSRTWTSDNFDLQTNQWKTSTVYSTTDKHGDGEQHVTRRHEASRSTTTDGEFSTTTVVTQDQG